MSKKKRLKISGRKFQMVGLALLTIVTVGVVAYALKPQTVQTASPAVVQPTATATAAPAPLAVFIGDSYTQGRGASSEATRWVTLVAKAEKWGYVNLGRGGTGYLATSNAQGCGLEFCPNYAGMIPAASAQAPAYIVIAGGQNDFAAFNTNRQGVTEAIRKTYTDFHAKFPKAQIVAVGPSTPWGVNRDVEAFDQVVQDAASSVGAKFVSLIAPDVLDPSMLIEDKAHPNDAGHKAIAERVIAALR